MAVHVYQKEAVVLRVSLNAMNCVSCGVVFAISDDFEAAFRKSGQWFYCPNGHAQRWSPEEKSQIDTLNAEIARLTRDKNYLREFNDQILDDLNARTKELKAVKRRANAGVCLDCNRTFQNVQRHRASKHPE